MNTTLIKMTNISHNPTNYKLIAPMAMGFALIGIGISSAIMILILLTKKITHSATSISF